MARFYRDPGLGPTLFVVAATLYPAASLAIPDNQMREAPDAGSVYIPTPPDAVRAPASTWTVGRFTSVQVNVDSNNNNILGDAANEPSMAVDPTNPDRIVIGWRQFNTITNSFRQAGWAYSHDGGATWTFPGVINPGLFRSDPVLEPDADGNIYYNSLTNAGGFQTTTFKSADGGVTWDAGTFAYGGDKQWYAIDRTNGPGRNNHYENWNRFYSCPSCGGGWFTRSINNGASFQPPLNIPHQIRWGTLTVDPDGTLFMAGTSNFSGQIVVLGSSNAQNDLDIPLFEIETAVELNGFQDAGGTPNPGGLLGQIWIAADHSTGPRRGYLYVCSSVTPFIAFDPQDVMCARSADGGLYWDPAVRVNDDPLGNNAWQWFGTMDVAPNGRIDVVWNDTRHSGIPEFSELHYSFSMDGGQTWSQSVAVSPMFNSTIGWPAQNKIGDYYDITSENGGAHVAYSATMNGGQDVYYVFVSADCNSNGVADLDDISGGFSTDCDGDDTPDECDFLLGLANDCDGNFVLDECQPDTDADGVIDACDNCPQTPNANQGDGDFDGQGDVCDPCPVDFADDSDGDGACDSDEQCPFDPNKLTPGVCGCGTPDTDTDGDAVADCIDQCPGVDDALYAPGCAGAIPTVSTWGMAVLGLLLLVGAKVKFARPREST